jgi:hypothetical protein
LTPPGKPFRRGRRNRRDLAGISDDHRAARRINFTPKSVNGVAMHELKIPIRLDRLLVSLVTGLQAGFSRIGMASPRGTAIRWKPPLAWLGREVSGVAA